jgi:hypothetical protein
MSNDFHADTKLLVVLVVDIHNYSSRERLSNPTICLESFTFLQTGSMATAEE